MEKEVTNHSAEAVEAADAAFKTADQAAQGPGDPAAADASAQEQQATSEAGDISELLRKLDGATAEANLQRERYLRAIADLENYRKRALREKEDARRGANYGLVEDLVPVMDNFALGLASARNHEGGEVFAEGFAMILKQMGTALSNNGLEEVNPVGAAFDPNFHESHGMRADAKVPEGNVLEVHRVGYLLHGRLLRPATVIVSSGPESSE